MNHILYHGVFTSDKSPHWTSACIDCGACEQKCPQNIKVRQEFIHVRKYLEGPMKKSLAWIIRKFVNRRRKQKTNKS